MSAGTSWTLWQRMPPRYQLTTRGLEHEEAETTLLRERTNTPVSARSIPAVKRPYSAAAPTEASFSTLMSSDDNPSVRSEQQTRQIVVPQSQFSFPNRRSGYVDHIKIQRRVNSARIKLAESPVGNMTLAQNARAKTAPNFPITNPSAYKEDLVKTREHDTEQRLLVHSARNKTKQSTEATRVIGITNMSLKSQPPENSLERSQKKYMVQEVDNGTMYIDNGKVIYFRKSRHDLSNLLNTHSIKTSKGAFLAGLRQEYLKQPKVIAYGRRQPGDVKEQRMVLRERMDYNRRVGYILDYYSYNEQDKQTIHEQERIRESEQARVKSLTVGVVKGLCLSPTPAPSRSGSLENSRSSTPDRCYESNQYMRLNRRSRLHERKFYLRTPGINMCSPGIQNITARDIENCSCTFCRMEMEFALVSQANNVNAALTKAKANSKDSDFKVVQITDNSVIQRETTPANSFEKEDKPVVNDMTGKGSAKQHSEQTLKIQFTLPEMRDTPDINASESGFETGRRA
ncbi:hypothetical protein CHS0354_037668 [Potamilus streckersoni]|uniref:Uncharacterized protein n=1 Tax=Potamilus streckersoni TaxID=2493646 RepID=A0AAE0W4M7_9BIVA|nr:hypothetical protein CHS0354_037668 [Potamilus streckersoni]